MSSRLSTHPLPMPLSRSTLRRRDALAIAVNPRVNSGPCACKMGRVCAYGKGLSEVCRRKKQFCDPHQPASIALTALLELHPMVLAVRGMCGVSCNRTVQTRFLDNCQHFTHLFRLMQNAMQDARMRGEGCHRVQHHSQMIGRL